jgi:hypothetical protein
MAELKRHKDVLERVLESALLRSRFSGMGNQCAGKPDCCPGTQPRYQAFSTIMRPPISMCSA